MFKRAGKDPARFDKRPFDVIPYDEWAEELRYIKSLGYKNWQDYQKDNFVKQGDEVVDKCP